MTNSDVIRAWKDPAYRASLTDEQRNALPASPAGVIDVTEMELNGVEGGGGSHNYYCVRLYHRVNILDSIGCPFVADIGRIVTLPANAANPAALGGMTLHR